MNRAQIVRDKRPFAVWDLLVYALILLLIAVLFVVFVFSDAFGTEDARGVRVEVDGVTGKMRFNTNGEPEKSAKFVQIMNGEYSAM